jgi:hypothetical protein
MLNSVYNDGFLSCKLVSVMGRRRRRRRRRRGG